MSRIDNGRGPLGQKQPKPAKTHKPLRKISAKRAAYMESDERKAGLARMGLVAQLPCFVCGARPVEVHHLHGHGLARSDMHVVPLCPQHHRREFGPGAYHYSPSAFFEAHGTAEELLARVADILRNSA